jgi:hypothetical protein
MARPIHSISKLFVITLLIALVWVALCWIAYAVPSVPTVPYTKAEGLRIAIAKTRLGLGILWSFFILFLAIFAHMSFVRLPLMWRDRLSSGA